ncbi:MAG: AraC family ligand binding domain-containing protein [Kiloniellales bacterium]
MELIPAITSTGTTLIARVVDSSISRHIGGGIEYLENATIDWTVTYDEILFVLEGPLTIELDDGRHTCESGDVVWLPNGTHLKYIAEGRAAYFYALHPVDWAARQGTREP